jgi:hypothetical protein
MKALKVIVLISLVLIFSLSCDNPVGLGARLDIEGPVVKITSPSSRKAVQTQFEIAGTIFDNNSIAKLLVTASLNNKAFPKQWQYNNGNWTSSIDSGANWLPLEGASWEGSSSSVSWKVPIDMDIEGESLNGEYTFTVQAWDNANFTDDNSFKTIVLIFDSDPPKISVSDPFLYLGKTAYETSPLQELHNIADTENDWQDPANIGKFITSGFNLQWQIEDNFDVWSMDLRLYKYDAVIDESLSTPLPDDYIYYYHENLPPPSSESDPQNIVKPNGSIFVPDLTSDVGNYDGAELKNPLTEKTTIKVVAVCYDSAGNPNQEKTLGYFVFWPKADEPWVMYTDGMQPPDSFYGKKISDIEDDVFMIYPGRTIKAAAYQVNGVSRVEYSLFRVEETGEIPDKVLSENLTLVEENVVIENEERSPGVYSSVFPWEFEPPSSSAYYVVKTVSYDAFDNPGEEYTSLFRVQDITFPDFPISPEPNATEPLFISLKDNSFNLSGEVSDVTGVVSLALVWINPESRNYAAMSQLSYFRDQNYVGWMDALDGKTQEGRFDPAHPNRLWKLDLTDEGENPETYRRRYSYSQNISLPDDLNIGVGKQPLKSQVFLLRVENTTGKCAIITYAPQGDTLAPSIKIENVTITDQVKPFIPGQYNLVTKLKEGDIITINGTWTEDSTDYLSIKDFLIPNFKINVNGTDLVNGSGVTVTFDPNEIGGSGTWKVEAVVTEENILNPEGLKDSLVISTGLSDIGGNIAEAVASWLIESDNVKLLRVTSDSEDKLYKEGDSIEVILEFNKPVRLKNGGKPSLKLNSSGTAVATYKDGQGSNSSRQYFEYTVEKGDTTGDSTLNVISLANEEDWNSSNYPFTWIAGSSGTVGEEIRVTGESAHDGTMPEGIQSYYAKKLPVTIDQDDDDYQFTLGAGKRIQVDTISPTVTTNIESSTLKGSYSTGDIYIDVEFSEPVTIPDNLTGTALPKLTLQVGDQQKSTVQGRDNIKIAGNKITFVYSVGAGDDSAGDPIEVTAISSGVTDIAGNALDAVGLNKTLDGIFIDTTAPGIPVVKVLTANNNDSVITNIVNSTPIRGESTTTAVDLKNVYHNNLWIAIERNGTETEAARIEYTITGDTNNYAASNVAGTPFALNQKGINTIRARQVDNAGNTGSWSNAVSFNWDPGAILTRISSTSANGIYNSVAGRNTIDITLSFRKPVTLGANTSIEINAQRGGQNIILPIITSFSGVELKLTYTVQNGDILPESANKKLDVLGINANTILDENGVDISSLVNVGNLQGAARLNGSRSIDVDTSTLTADAPEFTEGDIQPDNSSHTTLEIEFNREVFKGEGKIEIIQVAEDFLLPAVMTEAQYNRLRTVPRIDTFYTRGTNGLNPNRAVLTTATADTATKYILDYEIDPKTANDDSEFLTAFRQAEGISIPVNNQAVSINGDTVTITLTGANAPQVPGAQYTIKYPAGFVRDTLGNANSAFEGNETLGGVARPFVRIKKTQDTITPATGSGTQPRLVAAQPLTAEARMDTRTPGASITYTASTWNSTTNGVNWDPAGGPDDDRAQDQATRPENSTENEYDDNNKITIGGNVTVNDVQGHQWWVRAIATDVNDNNSQESEEMAYRTVITYNTGGMTAAANAGEQVLGNGDQVWIRGGDAISSSSIPGFPFTWEDNWTALSGKRAGIRLMTKTGGNNATLNNTTWKFVTWDMNATAYVDIIMGHDTASSTNLAWQYGPKQWAYQRAGWTSFKEQYPIYAGKHRWLDASVLDGDAGNKGAVNFSGTFSSRPDFTDSNIPGANTN